MRLICAGIDRGARVRAVGSRGPASGGITRRARSVRGKVQWEVTMLDDADGMDDAQPETIRHATSVSPLV